MNRRSDTAEESINFFENCLIETAQNKAHRKDWKNKDMWFPRQYWAI